jgi:hypothetical protein
MGVGVSYERGTPYKDLAHQDGVEGDPEDGVADVCRVKFKRVGCRV